jgi:hypothetical protein
MPTNTPVTYFWPYKLGSTCGGGSRRTKGGAKLRTNFLQVLENPCDLYSDSLDEHNVVRRWLNLSELFSCTCGDTKRCLKFLFFVTIQEWSASLTAKSSAGQPSSAKIMSHVGDASSGVLVSAICMTEVRPLTDAKCCIAFCAVEDRYVP